ncbi:MAG: hypothetical protein N3B15_00660 [Planctomycetota bacterium]|nr:hypothetical protein [Planctomycetota bacterium]
MPDFWADLAARNLGAAGRHEEALQLVRDLDLAAILRHNAHRSGPPPPDPRVAQLLAGWQAYHRADYAAATAAFAGALAATDRSDWLAAWAMLGIAKAATDLASWTTAWRWCALAAGVARFGEHLDLLAACAGARGEILLRAGHPLLAAQAFAEDLALLPPGSRYAGRVRCCLAHAWARLGERGRNLALAAYRVAAHTPGEPATRDFACAGMALLGAELGLPSVVETALAARPAGIAAAWCHVAAARLASDPTAALHQAWAQLPSLHRGERRWLRAYAAERGVDLPGDPAADLEAPCPIPDPLLDPRWPRCAPIDADEVPDPSPTLPDLWSQRRRFMP